MTHTILADICKSIPGYEVLSKIYPKAHGHKNESVMNQKVKRHIEPPIDLSEMETANMVRILEKLSMRYLELIAEKLEGFEKKTYSDALFDMRSGNSCAERLEEAEAYVMDIVMRFGKLLLLGDQLTVSQISLAQ